MRPRKSLHGRQRFASAPIIGRLFQLLPYLWGENMNQQERDELREKHTLEPYEDRITGQEVATCAHCCTDEWPCDVIKVLDAWEQNSNGSITELTKEQ